MIIIAVQVQGLSVCLLVWPLASFLQRHVDGPSRNYFLHSLCIISNWRLILDDSYICICNFYSCKFLFISYVCVCAFVRMCTMAWLLVLTILYSLYSHSSYFFNFSLFLFSIYLFSTVAILPSGFSDICCCCYSWVF